MQRIALEKVRKLEITRPSTSERPSYFSSASGIVVSGDQVIVVADDEHSVGVFSPETTAPGDLITLEENELPLEKKARKKTKPDHEALLALDDQLLAIPSGSKPNRRLAHEIHLRTKQISRIDFSGLFLELENTFADLNIEGAALVSGAIYLAQRGNSVDGKNALISLDQSIFLGELVNEKSVSSKSILKKTIIELGMVESVPFTITDISPARKGKLLFTAAAEATESTFEDGEIRGSCFGVMNLEGKVEAVFQTTERMKIEGIALDPKRNKIYFVTDADDPNEPSWLYALDAKILFQDFA